MATLLTASSLKVMSLSTAIVSLAVALNLSAPPLSRFLVDNVPFVYDRAVSFLRPPYLYLLINCIIISIVATSRLQQRSSSDGSSEETTAPVPAAVSGYMGTDYAVLAYCGAAESNVRGDLSVAENGPRDADNVRGDLRLKIDRPIDSDDGRGNPRVENMPLNSQEEAEILDEEGKTIHHRPSQRAGSLENSSVNEKENSITNKKREKPAGSASARFCQRRSIRASTEGETALRVTKPGRQETLESTWKAITEGRSMPLTRNLKKSDTWEAHALPPKDKSGGGGREMAKSETFSERTMTAAGRNRTSSTRVKKREPPLSQEELNRRVEAFIKKFNEEMRLQRQESLARYQEMPQRRADD